MKSGFFGNFFFYVLITMKFFDRFIKCPCFLFSMIGGLINLLSTLHLYVYMNRWIQFLLTYFHHFLQLCFFCIFCFCSLSSFSCSALLIQTTLSKDIISTFLWSPRSALIQTSQSEIIKVIVKSIIYKCIQMCLL